MRYAAPSISAIPENAVRVLRGDAGCCISRAPICLRGRARGDGESSGILGACGARTPPTRRGALSDSNLSAGPPTAFVCLRWARPRPPTASRQQPTAPGESFPHCCHLCAAAVPGAGAADVSACMQAVCMPCTPSVFQQQQKQSKGEMMYIFRRHSLLPVFFWDQQQQQ